MGEGRALERTLQISVRSCIDEILQFLFELRSHLLVTISKAPFVAHIDEWRAHVIFLDPAN